MAEHAGTVALATQTKTSHVLTTGTRRILFSYGIPVAFEVRATGALCRTEENHSRTTAKHIGAFLARRPAERIPQSQLETQALQL